jgi:hypothetical protein
MIMIGKTSGLHKGLGEAAMTLAELLIASILIGIVMVGAFSFSQIVKQIHQSTDRSTIPAARVAYAIAQMKQDAALTVGDGHHADGGPVDENYGVSSDVNAHYICFRHDTTPDDQTDDTEKYTGDGYEWICYSHNGDGVIKRCAVTNANIGTFSGCAAGPTVLKLPTKNGVPDFFTVNVDGNNVLENIELILTTRILPNEDADPINNPEFTITTTVNPWGQGR